MMRQMRENTKWIMLVTALAFVGLMVFEWGMDLTGRSGAQAAGGEIGRVNGESISYEEYINAYNNLQQQQVAAGISITPVLIRQLEEAAWDQVVTQRLLQQEMRRRGIRITDDEIRQAALYAPPPDLQQEPMFQTDGQFDPAKYQQFLASASMDDRFLRQLESYYRDVLPRSKLFFQNMAGVFASDAQLWRMWRDATETATIQYIVFAPDALVADGDVTVTDQSIREYYNRRREDFVRPALASVRYVSLDRTPTAADTARARQLALQHREAIAGGENFDTVATRAAGDAMRGTTQAAEFTLVRGQALPALEEAVFATQAGQLTQPVPTQAGFHVMRVESRAADTARVRQLLIPIELAEETENALLDRADELERAAEGVGLRQAASQMGLQVQTAELSEALPLLPGVGSVEEGVEWAFRDAEVGEASPVFEGEQSFYIVELVSRRDEGALSLQEATPTIRSILLRDAKLERARQVLADAERRARAGESLQEIAPRYNATAQQAGPFTRGDFVPGLGRLNAAIGAAFGLRPGQTSPLTEADQQLYLVRLQELSEASPVAWREQLDDQRARVHQALADTRWNQFMTALRDDAEIVDNRRQLLRRGGTTASR
jgi:peptidyl-prolyl cis-trans isomerase D